MPRRRKFGPERPVPVQLPLFAEAASLIRVRPERNEFRYYRMEIWPDLFGRALLLRQWSRIGTQGRHRLDLAPHEPAAARRAWAVLSLSPNHETPTPGKLPFGVFLDHATRTRLMRFCLLDRATLPPGSCDYVGCKNGGWREAEARFLACSRGVATSRKISIPASLYRNTPVPRLGGMAIDVGTVARIIHPGPRPRRRV